jgi:glycosyltransferase involved in cell wall biosynthesis
MISRQELIFYAQDLKESNNMKKETVSVIIPVFNRGKALKEAVMSVLLQSHILIEIIIVDDGSTDDTKFTAEILARKWPQSIKVFSQENSGPGGARELGTIKSTGEFIQYLDSDDILVSTKFQSQIKALKEHPESEIAYGISYQADYSFNPPLLMGPLRSTGEEILYLFPKLLNERWWTTSCPLYRRSLVERIGPWKDLINEEDWEFDARAARLHTRLIWVEKGVSIRRIHLGTDHLSSGGCSNRKKMCDRVIAKQLLFKYAIDYGIQKSDAEMRLFARECFLLSRQSAGIALSSQSRIMYMLARNASTALKRYGLDYICYGLLGHLVGWERVGRLASRMRNML